MKTTTGKAAKKQNGKGKHSSKSPAKKSNDKGKKAGGQKTEGSKT